MSEATEWQGPASKDLTIPVGEMLHVVGRPPIPGRLVGRRKKVRQRDGSHMVTEVAYTDVEWAEKRTRPVRQPKKTPEPREQISPDLARVVDWLDEQGRDPRVVVDYRQVPPDRSLTKDPADFERAQLLRRLRAPELWVETYTEEHCRSAMFGCTEPVTRQTPEPCCTLCYKFHHRHTPPHWPSAADIEKRHARAARAAEKSREVPNESP